MDTGHTCPPGCASKGEKRLLTWNQNFDLQQHNTVTPLKSSSAYFFEHLRKLLAHLESQLEEEPSKRGDLTCCNNLSHMLIWALKVFHNSVFEAFFSESRLNMQTTSVFLFFMSAVETMIHSIILIFKADYKEDKKILNRFWRFCLQFSSKLKCFLVAFFCLFVFCFTAGNFL